MSVFFQTGTIIYGHGSKTQIWDIIISLDSIAVAVEQFPVIVRTYGNLIVPVNS